MEEFLSFDTKAKLYHLGVELYSLGAGTRQFFMRDRFHTTLEKISQQTNVTSDSIGVGVPIFNIKGQVVTAISMASITVRMDPERCREIARIIQSEIAAVDPPPN